MFRYSDLFDNWQERRGLHEKPSFSFKGVNSEEFGIVVNDLGEREYPEQEQDTFDVPFSDKTNIILHPHHKPYKRVIEITFNQWQRNAIYDWLRGYGRLETTNDDLFFFEATVSKVNKPLLYKQGLMKTEIEFIINPYAYLYTGEVPINVTNGLEIINPGTWYAKPTLTITGTGNGEVSINGRAFQVIDLAGEITVNSTLKKVHYGLGNHMTGEFPYLDVDKNTINFNGGITSIVMIPRWCNL